MTILVQITAQDLAEELNRQEEEFYNWLIEQNEQEYREESWRHRCRENHPVFRKDDCYSLKQHETVY